MTETATTAAVSEDGHTIAILDEPFDSELLDLRIGRLAPSPDIPRPHLDVLLARAATRARSDGFDQLLHRVPASSSDDIWALEDAGYQLMDIGVTFARRLDGPRAASARSHVAVRPASSADIEELLETMLDVPWGSRYEADPAYSRAAVRRLQAQWLRNSLSGRADHVLIGVVDGRPAGYVTCRFHEEDDETAGEIDLVGTVPAFRGRGVAATVVAAALGWFSTRVSLVTVRTQATNTVAAGVYERAGMTLHRSDLTFRLALTPRGGRR